MWKVRRCWKDGRMLVAEQITKSGMFGYGADSPDYNRYLLKPNGTFKAHIYCGFCGDRVGQELEFDGKTYKFAGYY